MFFSLISGQIYNALNECFLWQIFKGNDMEMKEIIVISFLLLHL